MNPWLALLSPFALGALIIAAIKGWEAYDQWRERRDMRIRDHKLNRYNMAAFRGSKDRYE